MTTSTLSKAATGALIALTLAPISVEATITSVTVNTSRDYEHAGGYAYAEITVHGTVDRADGSVGVYAVPAVLIHPRPIFRAALENLTGWTSGNHRENPPPSQYFRGSVDAIDAFVPTTDVDGHFTGGVRLPHVESTMHGRVAGAPLGRHTPLNPLGLDPFNLFVFVSGTFTRFSDDELADRYGSCEQYASRVRRAADHLAASGYITNTDRMALIAAAKRETLPEELQCPK